MTASITHTGTPYEIDAQPNPYGPTTITVTAGTTPKESRPRLMLLVPSTTAPPGDGTILEFNDTEAALLAEAIYANLTPANRDQVRAALNNIDQEDAQ